MNVQEDYDSGTVTIGSRRGGGFWDDEDEDY